MSNDKFIYKVVFVGDSGVGKSQTLHRFDTGSFNSSSKTTINVDFVFKTVLFDKQKVVFQFYDTAGQERFNSIPKDFYRDSAAFVFVFDLNRRETLFSFDKWINDILEVTGKEYFNHSVIYIIGNKRDLERSLTREDISHFLDTRLRRYTYFETSAKTGENIVSSFMDLIGKVHLEAKDRNRYATSLLIDKNVLTHF